MVEATVGKEKYEEEREEEKEEEKEEKSVLRVSILVTVAVEEDDKESWSPFAVWSSICCRNISGVT